MKLLKISSTRRTSPEGKGSTAAIGAHLVRKELSREGEGNGTDAKAKGDSKGEEKEDRKVAERWVGGRKLKVVVDAKEEHDQRQGEATSGKLGSSVHPGHDQGGKDHPDREGCLEKDGKEGGGQVDLSRSGICCLSQSVKCDTSAYIPRASGAAHPLPQLTTPMRL